MTLNLLWPGTFEDWLALPMQDLPRSDGDTKFKTGQRGHSTCTYCGAHVDDFYNPTSQNERSALQHVEWHCRQDDRRFHGDALYELGVLLDRIITRIDRDQNIDELRGLQLELRTAVRTVGDSLGRTAVDPEPA